jgi:hypothetical protein
MALRNQLQNHQLGLSFMMMTEKKSKRKAKEKIGLKGFLLMPSQSELVTCNNILDRSSDTRIECHFIDLCVAFFSGP